MSVYLTPQFPVLHFANFIRHFACVCISVAILLPGTVAFGQETTGELEKSLEAICRKHNVPSLSIAAVRSDEVLTTLCWGIRKRGTEDQVELTDRHPLASNTKSMTATLAAIVVERGKIRWDSTISEVWRDLDEKNLHPSLRDVTLDDLLSHQSGLRGDIGGIAWATFFAETGSPSAERRRMLKLILKVKPEFSRGEYHYSNLGYAVVAAMLEKSTGEAFETMMLRDVFKPLKMDSADFRTMKSAKQLKAPMLWGHQANGKPISPKIAGAENPSVYASAGTVNLTIADYAKYARWHLKDEPAPLLSSKEALEHLHTGVIDAPSLGGKYGGGWIHLNAGFGRAMTHTGSNTNSFAVLWILPDKDFAAIACCNTGEQSGFLACDAAIVEMMKRYAK